MDLNLIHQFSLFNDLTDDELNHFKGAFKEVNVSTGTEFIVEGEIGDSIYLLVDGTVEITQNLTLPLSKDGGDTREKAIIKLSSDIRPLFGEMSLFSEDDRRTATVRAITDCRLAKLMKQDLFRICDAYPKTGYKVMRNLCKILCGNLVKANQNVLKLTTAFSLALER
ncbi:MAG: cyclic nucleotide-binding domain-containing protein [FCB group bacterium]|nr:cyclic nucleotide-binding domain-containing protein [FCB group bacterium]